MFTKNDEHNLKYFKFIIYNHIYNLYLKYGSIEEAIIIVQVLISFINFIRQY